MKENLKCICNTLLICRPYSANFDQASCSNCGCVRFSAVKDNQVLFQYDSNDEKYGNEFYLLGSEFRWSHNVIAKKLSNISGRILEIGCFNGFFVDRLRRDGFDAIGFDLNKAAVSAGRRVYGLGNNLYHDLDDALACGPFDAILMIDVLEHISDAGAFLDELIMALAPGGMVLVAGPTSERPFVDKTDFPPHHLWRFTRRGLLSAGQQRNLESQIVDVEYDAALLLRNVAGRLLNGISKKEYFGEGPSVTNDRIPMIVTFTLDLFRAVFRPILNALGISYCSAVIAMRRR
jgi:2-polyprenyl-3-methyl-5-hydroxy-6-metoxy-1,4-benzoquinol methylase